jgi:CheY-like chemotaxis protein
MSAGPEKQPVEILLVEDDPADVLLVQEGLRDGPVPTNLTVMPDGVEALAYLRAEPPYAAAVIPDLILLDLKMPKKGGLEVLGEIKADPELHRIPVIILTTSDAPDDVFRAYDRQASLFITKPEDLEEFDRITKMIRDFCITVVKLPPRER